MSTVFVTGGGGQLARAVTARFREDHEIVAPTRTDLDVTRRDAVLAAVTTTHPDIIIHCGAWTDVDGCERDPDRAFATNTLGTRYVAEAADRVGAHLCYVSTDYVFDGTRTTPYDEWQATNPVSEYGRSKLAGEHEAGPSATVVRTSWLSADDASGGFVRAILDAAARDAQPIRVVADQRSRPTLACDLAGAIKTLLATRAHGRFHVTNQGDASRFELARAIVGWAGEDPSRLEPVATGISCSFGKLSE